MLDARFLIDVHFQQGGKDKAAFPVPANTEEHTAPPSRYTAPVQQAHSEGWHREQEHLADEPPDSNRDDNAQ